MTTNNTEGVIPEEFIKWSVETAKKQPDIFYNTQDAVRVGVRDGCLETYLKLTETKATALREQQMNFAFWMYKKGYYVPNSNHPRTWCNGDRSEWPQMCYTDDELYELYLQDITQQ